MAHSSFCFEEPEHSPGFLMWQTTVNWQRLIKKALEPHHISHAQFVLLALLLWKQGKGERVTQVDLVKMSQLDKMTVSKSLKKLVSMNLVERYENQEDTRAKLVLLTEAGAILTRKLVPMVKNRDADFFGQLNNQEKQGLIGILKKLIGKKL